MEPLFTQNLSVNGTTATYSVSFHNEAYYFDTQQPGAPSFSIKREHDEWISNGKVDEAVLSAATTALDKYLLSQH